MKGSWRWGFVVLGRVLFLEFYRDLGFQVYMISGNRVSMEMRKRVRYIGFCYYFICLFEYKDYRINMDLSVLAFMFG